jgi:hypothetical protein
MTEIREHSPLAPARTRLAPSRYVSLYNGFLMCGKCFGFFPWEPGLIACPSCVARKKREPWSVEVIEHDGEPD